MQKARDFNPGLPPAAPLGYTRVMDVVAALVFGLVLMLTGAFAWRAIARRKRRAALRAMPLAPDQRALLNDLVPLTQHLPDDLRPHLEGKINLFLDQVDFQGCNGLVVSDEMRLSIAAQACLLVVNTTRWYDGLTTILIYPGAFKSINQQREGYVVHERETVRTGESWINGPVILSWQHVDYGAHYAEDGQNVVFHEFAHQLDDQTGRTNGVPLLSDGQGFDGWEHAMLRAFERHVKAVEVGHPTLINAYGATGYEEFFAVIVELFLENPTPFKRDDPALYQQLVLLFHIDPATWT